MKWRIETIPINRLQEWDGNPRKITAEDLELLKQSFIDYGAARTLTCNPIGKGKYEIIGGNQSLKALRELGYKEIQCSIPERALEETEKRKLAIYLNHRNKGEGKWDYEKLSEWDAEQLEDWGVELPETEEENKPAEYNTTNLWFLNIEFQNEKQCEEWFNKLEKEGLKCKIVQ